MKIILMLIGVLLAAPSLASAQFFSGFSQGLNQGQAFSLQRQQLALQYQQLRLQQLPQWRAERRQHFVWEVAQWAHTVQQWRDLTGEPRMTEDELAAELDRLLVFDWERRYEETW